MELQPNNFLQMHHEWVANSLPDAQLLRGIALLSPALFTNPDVLAIYEATILGMIIGQEDEPGGSIGIGGVLVNAAYAEAAEPTIQDEAISLHLWNNVMAFIRLYVPDVVPHISEDVSAMKKDVLQVIQADSRLLGGTSYLNAILSDRTQPTKASTKDALLRIVSGPIGTRLAKGLGTFLAGR